MGVLNVQRCNKVKDYIPNKGGSKRRKNKKTRSDFVL